MDKIKPIIEKIKKSTKENRKDLLIVLIIWVLVILGTLFFYRGTLGKESIGRNYGNSVYELNENVTIAQSIPISSDIESVSFQFATYRRNNSGSVYVKAVGNITNNTYLDENLKVKFVGDVDFETLIFDKPIDSKDERIIITISSDSKEGESIGIYCNDDRYEDGEFFLVNGKEIDGTLTYKLAKENAKLYKFNFIVVATVITCLSLFLFWLILFKPKLEMFFSVLVLFLGLVFMIIITPLSPPDETIHYEYSLQKSNLMLFNDNVYDINSEYIDYMVSRYYSGTINDKSAYLDLLDNLDSDLIENANIDTYDVSIENVYSVTYIPQSLGLMVARLLKANPIKTFYAGRLTNLLFYTICIYIAIKNAPIYKTLIGIISSLPIFLQQAASYSYDCFINSMCFMIFSFFLKWMCEENVIRIKDYIFIFIICLALAPAKYIYGLLSLLFILVPVNRFSSKRKKVIMVTVLCFPMLYQLVPIFIPFISRIIKTIYRTVYAETNGKLVSEEKELYSMGYAIRNFKETLLIICRTIRHNIKTWFFESTGKYLSQLTLIIPNTINILSIICVILSSLIKEEYSFSLVSKIYILFLCVAIAMFAIGGMLFSETYKGDEYISGIQGRYFSPLLSYFFVVFANNKLNISKKYTNFIIFSYIIVIFEVIIYILSYTFIH